MGIIRWFDKLEDRVRFTLSRVPILYALISGVGVVLFFRGIWHLADELWFMTSTVSLVVSLVILLTTGAFVSHFLSEQLISSGRGRNKKIEEKTHRELHIERRKIAAMQKDITEVKRLLKGLRKSR
jgi:hypothetical protein